jgi:hypothetical protein
MKILTVVTLLIAAFAEAKIRGVGKQVRISVLLSMHIMFVQNSAKQNVMLNLPRST